MRLGQQASSAVERIVLAAPMPHRLVLHTTPALIELRPSMVGSDRSALSAFRRVGFSGPSPEPDVRLPPHPALHRSVPPVRRRSWLSTAWRSCCRGSGSG